MPDIPLELLRCPLTGRPLEPHAKGLRGGQGRSTLWLKGSRSWSLRDEAYSQRTTWLQRRQVEIRPSVARALVRRAIPSRTLAIGTAERYAHFARRLGEATADRQAKVLVIGGGQLGQGAASLFQSGLDVIESDVYLGPRVDVVCDGHNLPFPDETFDGVVLQAVLEHVLDRHRLWLRRIASCAHTDWYMPRLRSFKLFTKGLLTSPMD